jgi:hypothetical protein
VPGVSANRSVDYTSRTAARSGLLLINGVVAIWEAQGAVTRHYAIFGKQWPDGFDLTLAAGREPLSDSQQRASQGLGYPEDMTSEARNGR